MDGDGEELLAIVQGLDAPGVTLTVSNRARHNADRRGPVGHRIHINTVMKSEMPPETDQRHMPSISGALATFPTLGALGNERASVETTTGADFCRTSKAVQICDDRYTSSYKLAHCQITPSSPPEAVSEFPPQRREPCRNQGNFEIGGIGSGQSSLHSAQGSGQGIRQATRNEHLRASTSRTRSNGGSLIWRDRGSYSSPRASCGMGSSHRYCNSKRDTDAFESSLRKYPNMAPFRTASTDLIEKLIRYTQGKNFKEMSRSSKSMRSLRNQNSSEDYDLASKHQQTYTRRQDDSAPSSGVQVGYKGRTKNFKLYSPTSDSRNVRHRATAFSTSYDYLKAGSPDRRSNRSDGSPSPTGSRSPKNSRSPAHSPRFASPTGSKSRSPGRPDKSRRPDRPVQFEGSVRDLSLSEMSKYIRSTVRQICNERPVVFQVCPKLKNRYSQHKRVCPSKAEQSTGYMENEDEEAQASGSVLSRIIRSFSGWTLPQMEQGSQCSRADCLCTRATQCSYNPEVSTNNVGCTCKARTVEAKTSCSRDPTCLCTGKAQEKAYYNKRIDEEISEWLKNVPVHSIEGGVSKSKRVTAIRDIRKTLKQLPDDENYEENVRNAVTNSIDDLPLWHPGTEKNEMTIKHQLAEDLIDKILAIPRKPDRFRDIVKKWVGNLNFDDENEDVEKEVIIDNFVNKLKSLAAERPTCDMKYVHDLRKEISKLMAELPLNYDSVMLRKKAHQLAIGIVSLPKNIKLSGDTDDSTQQFEDNISEWICDHGLCRQLKKDPKLIESLVKKLTSQGIDDEELIDKIKELIFEFVDDVETAMGILDEFILELMKPLSSTDEEKVETFDPEEVTELVTDLLNNLPDTSDWPPSKFEEITEDLVNMIQDSDRRNIKNEELENDILEYLVDTNLPIPPADLRIHVADLVERLNILHPNDELVEQAKRHMLKDSFVIIEGSLISEEQKEMLKNNIVDSIEDKVRRPFLTITEDHDDSNEVSIQDEHQMGSKITIPDNNEKKMSGVSFTEYPGGVGGTLIKDISRIVNKHIDSKAKIHNRDEAEGVSLTDISQIDSKLILTDDGQSNLSGTNNQNVKETLLSEVSQMVYNMDLPEESQLDLKNKLTSSLGNNFDKSFTRLGRDETDLKQALEREIRSTVNVLPLSGNRQKELMKQVSTTLGKYMDKPLPCNIENVIKKEISDILEKCPVSKDKCVCGNLKTSLFDVVSQLLDMLLPKPLCNFIYKVEQDVDDVISRCPIDSCWKNQLKECFQDILTENGDRPVSKEVVRTIQAEMNCVCNKLPIPKDKKYLVKKAITASVSKSLDEILSTLCQDLNKLRKRLFDSLINVIEEPPITRGMKTNLKTRLKSVLLRNLHASLSDEEKQNMLDEISDVLQDDMSEEERNNLINKLSNKVETFQRKVKTEDLAEMSTKDVDQKVDRSSMDQQSIVLDEKTREDFLRKMEQVIDEAPISRAEKIKQRNMLRDLAESLKYGVNENIVGPSDSSGESKGEIDMKLLKELEKSIDGSSIPKGMKEELRKILNIMTDENLKKPLFDDALKSDKNKVGTAKTTGRSLTPIQEVDETKQEDNIQKVMEKIIEDLAIPEAKKMALKRKLKTTVADHFRRPVYDTIDLENETKINMLQDLDKVIDRAPIPKEKRLALKRILNDLTNKHFKKPLSDDNVEDLKDDINEVLNELNLPKDIKEKLKRELTAVVDENMTNYQANLSGKGVDGIKNLENETKTHMLQDLHKVIDEAPIPKEKRVALKKILNDLTNKHFKKPLSDDNVEDLKDDINEVLNELNLPKDIKEKLKRELTAVVDENMTNYQANLSGKGVDGIKNLENETKTHMLQDLHKVIDEAPIPKEKMVALKKILNDLTNKHFKKPLSDDNVEDLKDDINEVLNGLNLPKDIKEKLKRKLTAVADENMRNYQTISTGKGVGGLKDLENETKTNIARRLETVTDQAPIPREKKAELKKKLKDLFTKHFKKPLSNENAKDIKDDINYIIDGLNLDLPKNKKNAFKVELENAVDESMRDMHRKMISYPQKNRRPSVEESKTKDRVLRGIEDVIAKSAIPDKKKHRMSGVLQKMAADNLENDDSTQVNEINELKEVAQKSILLDHEKAIDKARIPKELKRALKKKLKEVTMEHFKKPLTEYTADAIKNDVYTIIDDLNIPIAKKDLLKVDMAEAIDANLHDLSKKVEEIQRKSGALDSRGKKNTDRLNKLDDFNESKKKTPKNILLGNKKATDEERTPTEIKKELKKKLKDVTLEHLKEPISHDTGDAIKDDMNETVDAMDLPLTKKDQLKVELAGAVDGTMDSLLKEMKTTDRTGDPRIGDESGARGHTKQNDESGARGNTKQDYEPGARGNTKQDYESGARGNTKQDYESGARGNTEQDYEPGASGNTKQDYEPGARGKTKQDYEPGARGKTKQDYEPGARGNTKQDYESGAGGNTKQDYKPGARGNTKHDYEPGAGGKTRQDYEPGARGNTKQDYEPGARGNTKQDYEPGAGRKTRQDFEPGARGNTKQDYESGARGNTKQDYEPGARGNTKQDYESGARGSTNQDDDEIDSVIYDVDSRIELSSTIKQLREHSPQDWRNSTSAAFHSGNLNFSLKELLATTKGVRKQWTKNLNDAVNKLPRLRNDRNDKDSFVTYNEAGQTDVYSTVNVAIPGSSNYQDTKSRKQFAPKSVPKNNKGRPRLSKIEETFAYNNTTKQNSPFTPKQNQISESDYLKLLNDTIKTWLDKTKIKIDPNEKNRIVAELATDVVERQKYLQEFGVASSTKNEDSEYLKMQLHRRVRGTVPVAALKTLIKNIADLAPKIDNIEIPAMGSMAKSSSKSSKKKNVKQKDSKNGKSQDTPGKTPTTDVPHTDEDFTPRQASTPNRESTEEDEFISKVTDAVTTWIDSIPIHLEPDVKAEVITDLISDIVERQEFLKGQPEKPVAKREEIENLKYQVFKRLNKVTDDNSQSPDIDKIEELYKMIYGDGRRKSLTPRQAQEFQVALRDEVADILNDFNICCERRNLLATLTSELAKLGKSNADQDEIIDYMVEAIRRITYLSDCSLCEDEAEDLAYKLLARTKKIIARIQSDGAPVKKRDFREAVMRDIGNIFDGCPMSEEKRRVMECQLAEDYAKDLGVPLEDSAATMNGADHYGMSFNGLSNFIDTWVSSIHTDDDETKGEDEINDMKKELAYGLIHKIGEMNIDPEIFNDDAMYEAVLREELDNMLADIIISDEDVKGLKENLVSTVLDAKQRAHDEFAGQAYKRNLRDTISKVLPEQRDISKEEQASLETLKDHLADAYIDLHFSGDNDSQRDKLKKKIANELNRFCKDYMNRMPCTPLSSQKINLALYTALNNVPLPTGDSIKYEVEQARIREEINDWIKELPIHPQNPTELLTRNKMVYVLAKKLFDIEVEGNDTDNELMREEIVKFLNKLPLEAEEEDNETLAEMLIEKLTATEESRKYNPTSNVTLDEFGNVSMETPVCPRRRSVPEKRKICPGPSAPPVVCERPKENPSKPAPKGMPPSTLSPEDKDHLERIRRRTCLSPSCIRSIIKNTKRKICPGPRPVDTGSQTLLKPLGYETSQSPICPNANEKKSRPCPGLASKRPQRPVCPGAQQKLAPCPGPSRSPSPSGHQLRRHTVSSSNISDCEAEVQPQIVIKQYYWNPNDKNSFVESEIPKSGRGNRGQTDTTASQRTGQTQCEKPRQSTYAQCPPPPPCRRPSISKIHEQDTLRVPYDFLTNPEPKPQRQPCWEQERPFQRPSNRDSPSPRSAYSGSPYMPSPCLPSPCMSPFGINNRSSPASSPYSKRDNEYRMKRDGLDHKEQIPCSSSRPSRKERVIELGSLDDLCNARPKKRHCDSCDWHFREEEEEDNFWSSPMRRVILDEEIDNSVVMERDQREERIRCKCKERLVPKPQIGRSPLASNIPSQQFHQTTEYGQSLKKCPKCCGHHCPYPSFLYFRK